MIHFVEEARDIRLHDPTVDATVEFSAQLVAAMTRSGFSLAVADASFAEVRLVDAFQYPRGAQLHDLVFQRGDAQRALAPVGFGDVGPLYIPRPVALPDQAVQQVVQILRQVLLILAHRDAVHPGRGSTFEMMEAIMEHLSVDEAVEGPEAMLRLLFRFPVQGGQGA